jgi:hypothetical protein
VPEGAKPEDFPYDPSMIQKWSMVHGPWTKSSLRVPYAME